MLTMGLFKGKLRVSFIIKGLALRFKLPRNQ